MSHEPEILQSLQLTTQLERSLRKLLGNTKALTDKSAKRDTAGKRDTTNRDTPNRDTPNGDTSERDRAENDSSRDRDGLIDRLMRQNNTLRHDNEYLSRELLKTREDSQKLRDQFTSCRKYAKFLQECNANLRKEMVYWMRKPVKIEQQPPTNQQQDEQDQMLLLTRMKERLESAKDKSVLNTKSVIEENERGAQQSEQKYHNRNKNGDSLALSKHCTSCNYYSLMMPNKKNPRLEKKKKKHLLKELGDLCDCHRKYLLNSSFKL